ncbi:unnamed protein product [Gordionus sp. m RMFG-2023]
MITSKGYPYENYEIVTEDGFFLQLHRIPFGKNLKNTVEVKASVYLQHGLLSTSCDFLMNLENQSLGYILADNGLDVWIGDIRGNIYSRKHKTYTTNDNKFWDWSFDEIAKYDIPAIINFIIKKANRDYVYYVGHSQGTTVAFSILSQNPKMASKVRILFALAPVAYLKHITSPIRYLAPLTLSRDLITVMLEYLIIQGDKEFIPSNSIIKWLAKFVCPNKIVINMCANLLYLIGGTDTKNFNQSRIPVYYGHYPAGTSVRNMVHFGQAVLNDDFSMYSLGFLGNLKKYGRIVPPSHDIRQMTTPTMIFWGQKDWLTNPKDVDKLISKISNLMGNHKFENSNHYDFVYGINAANDYYSIIVKTILDTEANKNYFNNSSI